MRLRPLLPVIAIATLVVIGCGGEDGPTKDDFIAKADAVCKDLEGEGSELERLKPRSPTQFLEYTDRAGAYVGDTLDRISAIELPKDGDDRAGAQAYVAQLRETDGALAELKTEAEALREGAASEDQEQVRTATTKLLRTAQQVKTAGDEADRRASEYGLQSCGEES